MGRCHVRRLRPLLLFLSMGALAGGIGSLAVPHSVYAQEQPTSARPSLPDLQPDKDWQVIDMNDDTDVRSRAWSDPASGCHLALFALPLPESAAADKILESMSAVLAESDYQLSKIESEDKPERLSFSGFGVTGIATLIVPAGKVREASMLTCFWNEREPSYCRALCDAADDKMRAQESQESQESQDSPEPQP